MGIVTRIIEERKKIGLSQSELAEKTGIRQATISEIENGKRNPRLDTLEKICNVLNIEL